MHFWLQVSAVIASHFERGLLMSAAVISASRSCVVYARPMLVATHQVGAGVCRHQLMMANHVMTGQQALPWAVLAENPCSNDCRPCSYQGVLGTIISDRDPR